MTDTSDAIRADIDRTRTELGQDVDALADKVTPAKIMDRQVEKVRGAVGSVRDRVMGAADGAASGASGAVDDVKEFAHRATTKAEGAPLAVGLIAFGAGLLVASLIPATRKEKAIAESVKETAQPLVEEVADVAKETAGHLQEPAQEAATAVKDRAAEAVQAVRSEATDTAGSVKDQAMSSRENLSGS